MGDLILNFDDARNFLDMLGGSDAQYAWRILPKGDGVPANHFGSLRAVSGRLNAANQQGAGVFLTVNETDGCGAKAENIVRVRAIFADLDGAPIEPILAAKPEPHMIIESSPGKYHAYWKVKSCQLDQFKPLQQAIARRFDSDPAVCDLPRIMRVPGFFHQKAAPFLSHIVEQHAGLPYTVDEIVTGLNLILDHESRTADSEPRGKKSPTDITAPLVDGERTAALTEFCGRFIRAGLERDDILLRLREWNDNLPESLPDKKLIDTLDSIYRCDARNRAANDAVIQEYNENHAVVSMGGKTVVLREFPDRVDFMSVTGFRDYYCNKPQIEGVAVANFWLRHPERRTHPGVVFDPSCSASNDEYNLWRGFAVSPEPGDCGLYLDHVRDNIAAGNQAVYQYLLDWMADAVQNPHRLPGVAIALRGLQGTGKGVFISQFGEIFGSHFKHVHTPDQLTGRFTQHLADALLVFADEVVWGGDKQREGVLKSLVTEKRRFVEPKGVNAYVVDNYVRLLMATNNDWAVPAGKEERRFCVLDVGEGRMQDAQYFKAVADQMESGGRSALLNMLLTRDITDVNIRVFPKTAALLDQKEFSFDSVTAWWMDCLREGQIVARHRDAPFGANQEWPDWLSTKELFCAYSVTTEGDKYQRNRAKNPSQFSKALRKLGPMTPSRKRIPHHNGTEDRPRGLSIPTLEQCRDAMAQFIGQAVCWED